MKRILLINGSPRKNGNTATALGEVARAAEQYGVETDFFHLGSKPVRGCIDCHACGNANGCAFTDDGMGELLEKIKASDGIVIGSPVYYAGPNGALCAMLDRVFYSSAGIVRGKPASAIAVCRRAGATAALDRLNKYITINEMPLISSIYWNVIHGGAPGEVMLDGEGMQTMRTLGKNMAHAVLNMPPLPFMDEERIWTNFIR